MKIKKLEWVGNKHANGQTAFIPFGYYDISEYQQSGQSMLWFTYAVTEDYSEKLFKDLSINELKQKAQEHFESIIKECIE